ncbi:MBL fold metallo-hydrolase [Hydrogenophaga sp. PBL-H3]|uniref:MBL fold metallo-hydrolase n=1 Tax=Hydrogenophaga sp. PBL-H3 TaxID=434010 RepID=UPI00138B09B1
MWFVIDSCIDRETKTPTALLYLNSIGVDLTKIKLVVCSHWHDDHIRGLSDILAAAPNARFCMSSALASKEFLSLLQAYSDGSTEEDPFTSGVAELTNCLKIVRSRNTPPKLATQDQRIFMSQDGVVELWTLSPSPENSARSLISLAKLMPPLWTNKLTLPAQGPNHVAVAMHFRAGEHSILLGSDLEEHGNILTGWSAVLASNEKPGQKASLYKVAHHGSITAEHQSIWTDLLLPDPLAILTPFSRSKLPRAEDIERIKARTNRVFITAHGAKPIVKRTGALAKMLKSKNMSIVDLRPGSLQCRIDCAIPDSEWRIVQTGNAKQL